MGSSDLKKLKNQEEKPRELEDKRPENEEDKKQSKTKNSVLGNIIFSLGLCTVFLVFCTPIGTVIQKGWALYSIQGKIEKINAMDLSPEETLLHLERIDISGLSYNFQSEWEQFLEFYRELIDSIQKFKQLNSAVASGDTAVTIRGEIFDLSKEEERAEAVSFLKSIQEEYSRKQETIKERIKEAIKAEFDI